MYITHIIYILSTYITWRVSITTLHPDAFGNEQGNKTRLMNILMQLRKCVDHPYLFDGESVGPAGRRRHGYRPRRATSSAPVYSVSPQGWSRSPLRWASTWSKPVGNCVSWTACWPSSIKGQLLRYRRSPLGGVDNLNYTV